jgi:hypothetical protein
LYSITSDMSRGIVSQKPFSRKKRRQSFRKMLNRSGVSIPEFKISQKLRNILSRWLCFTIVIIIWTIILLKLLFFQPWQTISQVKFSEDTLATYQDIELFNLVSNEVKWKNYYILLSDKDEILGNIQKKFPFVWKIEFQLEQPQEEIISENNSIIIWIQLPTLNWTWSKQWTWLQFIQTQFPLKLSQKVPDNWWILWVQLMYYEPTVLIQLNDKKYAVWNEKTYVEMKEWMLLWIRTPTEDDPNPEQLLTIETPQYLTWTNSLDWLFFEISLPEMLQIATLAKEEFWNNILRFVYLAGSTRFAIFTSDRKVLYFNFPDGWNIEDQRNSQIFKYNTLREKYDKFGNVEKIDLWSLENNKTIIKNY